MPNSNQLSIYFEETFLPDVLEKCEEDTKYKYVKAVRRFISWAGCDIQIHCVTDGLLERFSRFLIESKIRWKTVKAYRAYLKRIVRHKYPDRLQKECGRRPHESHPVTIAGLAERELDIDGSLYRFWRDVYVPKRMIDSKQCSVQVIKYTIVRFGKYLGRPPMLTDLTDDVVTDFMGWIVGPANLSRESANGSRGHLLSLWRYAVKRKLIETGPVDCDKLKRLRQLPEAWTMKELGKIIESAKLHTFPKTGMQYPPGVFFPALILVAYDTGLRLRALMGIELARWKPDRREISADAEIMKHRVAQTFQVSEQTRDAVQLMLSKAKSPDMEQTLLFPWPISREGFYVSYRRILERAGLPTGPRSGFHKLRRTSATHLTAALGIEAASRQLGHSSVEMTKRYVDPRLTNQHNAADHLPRPK